MFNIYKITFQKIAVIITTRIKKSNSMNLMKKFKFGAYALSFATIFAACSDDDDAVTPPSNNEQGEMTIAAKATYNANTSGKLAETTTVNSFWVNFKEIQLELQEVEDENEEEWDDNGFYDSDDDIELQGPFELDLLADNPIQLVNLEVPNGVYEEIEFEFEKSTNQDSDLFNQSIRMTGEIDGTPFVFWHDFEEEIEIDFEDTNQNITINNDQNTVVINFDLTGIVGAAGSVDLSTALDGNNDGEIVISPEEGEDTDGNQLLAGALKEAIKAQIELMEGDD
ncbi:DUF4382 domain-containing protein [Haloflavibacter putidus]|uniref:DUF4382 domain-containing protein n=2 Tax=Haloflavibacter putidus TaxID=2576776 RepID=A0A507ZKZ5_9FLAO|nr:DUF4382 domain-containing protein [Haloflavibacter putidus]